MTNPNQPKAIDITKVENIDNQDIEILEPQPSGALIAQRAIIASETFWLGGLRGSAHPDDNDSRYSKYMEP